MREREPDDHALGQVIVSLTSGGIVLRRQSAHDDSDFFYVKVRRGAKVTLTIRHVSGHCANSFVQTNYPGPPGAGNGGQDEEAVAANAPAIDDNGNSDTSVGDTPGTTQRLTIAPTSQESRTGLEAGFVHYGDSYQGADESTVGCTLLVTPGPAASLVTTRSPADRTELTDPDVDGQ